VCSGKTLGHPCPCAAHCTSCVALAFLAGALDNAVSNRLGRLCWDSRGSCSNASCTQLTIAQVAALPVLHLRGFHWVPRPSKRELGTLFLWSFREHRHNEERKEGRGFHPSNARLSWWFLLVVFPWLVLVLLVRWLVVSVGFEFPWGCVPVLGSCARIKNVSGIFIFSTHVSRKKEKIVIGNVRLGQCTVDLLKKVDTFSCLCCCRSLSIL